MGLARGWIWAAGGGGERVRCGEGVGSRRQRGVGGMGTGQVVGRQLQQQQDAATIDGGATARRQRKARSLGGSW